MNRNTKRATENCPCKKHCYNGPNCFKIINLEERGVRIFRFITGNEPSTGNDELLANCNDESAIIIHNTSDIFITRAELKAAMDPNSIACPRCRKYLEKAEKVIKSITYIERNGLLAICDHCINKNKILKSCKKCALVKKHFSKLRDLDTKDDRIGLATTKPDQKYVYSTRRKYPDKRKYNTPVKSSESALSAIDLGYIKSRSNKLWKKMAGRKYSDDKAYVDRSFLKTEHSEESSSDYMEDDEKTRMKKNDKYIAPHLSSRRHSDELTKKEKSLHKKYNSEENLSDYRIGDDGKIHKKNVKKYDSSEIEKASQKSGKKHQDKAYFKDYHSEETLIEYHIGDDDKIHKKKVKKSYSLEEMAPHKNEHKFYTSELIQKPRKVSHEQTKDEKNKHEKEIDRKMEAIELQIQFENEIDRKMEEIKLQTPTHEPRTQHNIETAGYTIIQSDFEKEKQNNDFAKIKDKKNIVETSESDITLLSGRRINEFDSEPKLISKLVKAKQEKDGKKGRIDTVPKTYGGGLQNVEQTMENDLEREDTATTKQNEFQNKENSDTLFTTKKEGDEQQAIEQSPQIMENQNYSLPQIKETADIFLTPSDIMKKQSEREVLHKTEKLTKDEKEQLKKIEANNEEQNLMIKLLKAKEEKEESTILIDLQSNKDAFEQAKQRMEKQNEADRLLQSKEIDRKKDKQHSDTDKIDKTKKVIKEDNEELRKKEADIEEKNLMKKLLKAKVEKQESKIDVVFQSNKDAFEQAKQRMEKQNEADRLLQSKEIDRKKDKQHSDTDKIDKTKKVIKEDNEELRKKEADIEEKNLMNKLLKAKVEKQESKIDVVFQSNKDAFEQAKQRMENQKEVEKLLQSKEIVGKKNKQRELKKNVTDSEMLNKTKNVIKEDKEALKKKEADIEEKAFMNKLLKAKVEKQESKVDIVLQSNKDAFEKAKKKLENQPDFDRLLKNKETAVKRNDKSELFDKGLDKDLLKNKKVSKEIKEDNIKEARKKEMDPEEQNILKKLLNAKEEKKEIKVDTILKSNKDAFEQAKQNMQKLDNIDKLLQIKEMAAIKKQCPECESSRTESSTHFQTLKNTNAIIVETAICKQSKHPVTEVVTKEESPFFFKSTMQTDMNLLPGEVIMQDLGQSQKNVESADDKGNLATQKKEKHLQNNQIDTDRKEPGAEKGIFRYALSDRKFIEKGWTMLPVEKVVRKMNVYRMRPARPEFNWFEHNKHRGVMSYDTGEKLAELDNNGRGQWFYKNGRVALDYYDCEELHAQQRVVLYSSKEPDERGRTRPLTILATFDYLGNGVVFDHAGKIRLKFNQTEGVVLDRSLGPVSNWKWHSLNDPPVLQQVMIDTQLPYKNPEILKLSPEGRKQKNLPAKNEDMLAIEFDNFIRDKAKKQTQKFKPFQIKMKALKINENFSLRILDQATVYILFKDGRTNLKLNIGMILDHKEIIDTDTAEVGKVEVSAELLPAKTESIANMQHMVEKAKLHDKAIRERALRIRPAVPQLSVDKMTAGRSVKPPTRADCPSSYVCANTASRRKPTGTEVYCSNTMY